MSRGMLCSCRLRWISRLVKSEGLLIVLMSIGVTGATSIRTKMETGEDVGEAAVTEDVAVVAMTTMSNQVVEAVVVEALAVALVETISEEIVVGALAVIEVEEVIMAAINECATSEYSPDPEILTQIKFSFTFNFIHDYLS